MEEEEDYFTLITTGIKRRPEDRWKYVDVRRSLLHRQYHIMDKNLEGSDMMLGELAKAGIISEYERDAIEHCSGAERGRKFLDALMKKDDKNTLTFLNQCKEGKYGRLLAKLAADMFESVMEEERRGTFKRAESFVVKIGSPTDSTLPFSDLVAPSRKVTPNYVQEDYARIVNQIEQFLDEEYILDFVKSIFLHVATSANGRIPEHVSNIIQEAVSVRVLLNNLEVLWSWFDMSFLEEAVKALKSQRSIKILEGYSTRWSQVVITENISFTSLKMVCKGFRSMTEKFFSTATPPKTLEELHFHKKVLLSSMDLNACQLHCRYISKTGDEIVWQLPKDVVPDALSCMSERVSKLKKVGVEMLEFGHNSKADSAKPELGPVIKITTRDDD